MDYLWTLFFILVVVFVVAGIWKVYEKAGQPGWAAIIPIYNIIVLLQIVGRPVWWIILMLIPIANIIVAFIVYIDLAKSFGKDVGFGIGLVLLGVVFFPLLGFGDAEYQGPAGPEGGM